MIDFNLISIWSVIVAALASFVLGGVWYAVAFREAWVRAYGFSDDELARMGASPHITFPVLLACDATSAFALAVLITNLDISGPLPGAGFGLLVWLGLVAAAQLATHHASARPLRGFIIDTGKHAASFAIMGAILAAWPGPAA